MRMLLFLLLPAIALGLPIDEDKDGFFEVNGMPVDRCPGTVANAQVDNYGCSCVQKIGCSEEWCCRDNPDPCRNDCINIIGGPICTAGTTFNACADYVQCPAEGCYASQDLEYLDFPKSGYGHCEAGLCIANNCTPTYDTSDVCDFEKCEKAYGPDFWCGYDFEFRSECKEGGIIILNSTCAKPSSASGKCMACGSACRDSDGLDSTTQGVVRMFGTDFADYCRDSRVLIEQICTPTGQLGNVSIDCAGRQMQCLDGKCYAEPFARHGESCSVMACETGLICAESPDGARICCYPGQCANGTDCVYEPSEAIFGGERHECDSGVWKNTAGWLACSDQPSGVKIISMSDTSGGHAAIDNPGFAYNVYCDSNRLLGTNPDTLLFTVSNPGNDAHISAFDSFPNKVWISVESGSIQCAIRPFCQIAEACLFSLSDPIDDAHIAGCNKNGWNKLCCSYYDDNILRKPPIMQGRYDGDIIIDTTVYANCYVLQGTIGRMEIPCIDSTCLHHSLAYYPSGNIYYECIDQFGNTNLGTVMLCSDKTNYGECSSERPYYCNHGKLVQDCHTCGCPGTNQLCTDGGYCINTQCLGPPPTTQGVGVSSHYLSVNNPLIQQTAQQALQEYAAYRELLPGQLQDPDIIMEAVAYYVDKHMTYTYDSGDSYAQSALETIQTSGHKCANDYCGDCEDHAILREALLRGLGITPECAFAADHIEGTSSGHSYNIVNYYGAYRIMDYGYLGSYFTHRWDQHITSNIWNDHLGRYWASSGFAAQYTYNYPLESPCPSGGWRPDTYYADICP